MKSEKGKTKSEKVWTSILFTFSLLLFTFAASAETVEYWDPVGKTTNSVEAVVVTGATTTLTGGWYVVTGEVSRAQINVTGTEARPVNLILADGAKLTARDSSDYHPGIKVASGAALNVYAQSVDADTMGQLSAKGGDGGAGIGGAGEGGTCGTVNIYGGKLTAVGGAYAAGIGGGGRASKTGGTGGTISIYGGIVTANGENGGAAIGGGSRADGGVISIYGGEVIADNTKGDSEGAGIGGGYAGAGGMILIAGGKVTAVGGYKDDGGAGIGGGEEGSGGTIMITGGIVNATGTDYAAGIGGGDEGAGGDVTISGGTVVAKAGKSSVWDIGSGDNGGKTGEFVVTGGSVLLANSGKCRDGYPKSGAGTLVYSVMFPGLEGKVTLEGLEGYGTNDIFADASGNVCLYLPNGIHKFKVNGEPYTVNIIDGLVTIIPPTVISYWDPISGSEKSNSCFVVDGSTVLNDGNWYVVTGKVECGSVAVNGNANLILAHGCELIANGGENQAGVAVSSGNSLTIYGQMAGTGKLTAIGGRNGAGIGGGSEDNGGLVTINGGVVTATGGQDGAGIGGGSKGLGGIVTINGGTVTATGGQHGAGIGGGKWGEGGTVTINGGTVTATGGQYAAGIGGGVWHSGGTVTINGGTVTATGGYHGAGIGGGEDAPGGMVTINDGQVNVMAGQDASVIGWGRTNFDYKQATVAISGGIFSWKPNDEWLVDRRSTIFGDNPDATTYADYPWAVLSAACVTFGLELAHMTVAWTSGDGSVTNNAIGRTFFKVLKGTTGVKLIFAPRGCYEIDKTEYAFAGPINEDCVIPAENLPTARLVWPVGYLQVEYIESTTGGGQIIDTGIKSSPTLQATMDYMAFEHTENVNLGTSCSDYTGWRYRDYSGGPLFNCGNARAGSISDNTLALNVRYVVNVGTEGNNIYLAVTNAETKAEVKSFTAGCKEAPEAENVFVFGGHSGASFVVCTPMRLYSLTFRDFANVGDAERKILAEFVPCVRTSDGMVGLYDIEGERFVKNAGSGTFVAETRTVTVPRHDHVTAFWTSGDGALTNVISEMSFDVVKGMTGVKVIFTPEDRYELDKTEYAFAEAINENCTIPAKDMPTATCLYPMVTVGHLNHITAAWTSGDGSVTNEICGTTFLVPAGTTGVKVIFKPKGAYELDRSEYVFDGALDEDCKIPVEALPTAQIVLPEGYERVEYIASTFGGGQYIDTGVKASSTLAATMDYMAFEHTGRVNLGTFAADNTDWRYFDYSGGPVFDCGSARAGSTSGNTLDLNVRYVVNVGSQGDNICLVVTNAETKAEVKSFKAARSGVPSAEKVFVFGGYSGDSLVCTSMRLYSLTLRDFANVGDTERTTIAEFVPCIRASDGMVGLYDIEGERFVENGGSGSFVPENKDLYATVTVPRHDHVTAFWTSGDGALTNAISEMSFKVVAGVPFKVLFASEGGVYALVGPSVYESEGISGDVTLTDEQVPVVGELVSVKYVDVDGSIKSRDVGEYGLVTNATTVLKSGWYVVVGKISRGSIAVSGNVKLILADGCELTATGALNQPGVAVASGNSLTIYGQTANTGRLTATGGAAGSGIGGGCGCGCGTVTINGGTVTASGGVYGAGIGCGGFANDAAISDTDTTGFVTINGGRLSVRAGQSASVIGAGYYCEAKPGTTRIFGGVFSWKPDEGWLADRVSMGVFLNLDSETRAGYPWTVKYLESVVIFEQPLVGMTAAWTSGDGTKTNEICGAFFKVPMGATDAKIVFTPESNYRFVEDGETGIRELPSPLVEDVTITPPRVERITVPTAGPWNVGDAVTAYVSDDGTLVIGGTGAMDDFASAADAPWDPAAVARVTVADDVTLGKNALAALSDTIRVSANESIGSMRSALGTSTGPSGAISAGFESIEVLDGTAYLGVAVKTNVNLTAEAQDWGKVGLEAKDVSVENGSVIIAVPANTEQGFFYLMSKPAVPSNKPFVPPPLPIEQ